MSAATLWQLFLGSFKLVNNVYWTNSLFKGIDTIDNYQKLVLYVHNTQLGNE